MNTVSPLRVLSFKALFIVLPLVLSRPLRLSCLRFVGCIRLFSRVPYTCCENLVPAASYLAYFMYSNTC